MTIDKRASKWGYLIILVAMAIYALFWVLLLEPIQNVYVERNLLLLGSGEDPRYPSIFWFGLFSLFVGGLFGFLTMVGFCLTKPGYFNITYQAEIGDVVKSKGALIWSAAWALLTFVFMLFWRGDL
jgi:hypothetical protein